MCSQAWILFKVEINEYFNKPHGTPPQPMFLVSFVGNRYILIYHCSITDFLFNILCKIFIMIPYFIFSCDSIIIMLSECLMEDSFFSLWLACVAGGILVQAVRYFFGGRAATGNARDFVCTKQHSHANPTGYAGYPVIGMIKTLTPMWTILMSSWYINLSFCLFFFVIIHCTPCMSSHWLRAYS